MCICICETCANVRGTNDSPRISDSTKFAEDLSQFRNSVFHSSFKTSHMLVFRPKGNCWCTLIVPGDIGRA